MTRQNVPIPSLSIGSIVGGKSGSTDRWRTGIRSLTNRISSAARGVSSPLKVNVIFQVPGHIITPDFSGVRTGYFSKKDVALIVQAALPEEAPDDVDVCLSEFLTAAIEEAEQWARQHKIADNLDTLRSLVEAY